ncbi:MAG: methyltransferase [Bacteroidales bacterium]|jgi:precorrin-6B methylase 2|nr:methyltransferase [Bacteroidales bacterium]
MKESRLKIRILNKEIQADRPEPIISNIDVVPFNREMDSQIAIDALIEGYSVLIVDFYSSGLLVLNALKKHLKNKYSDQSFQGQRDFRSVFREISHRILLVVREQKLSAKKAPEIGWLKILYPELNEFLLPFPQVQGLNSSWQWYQKGIEIPVLDRRIFPWFGTYFPTRFEHLKLFNSWLKTYKGTKQTAIDIGIGSGVLSFQMLKHGFEKVYGTDSNPNSMIGLNEDLEKNKLQSRIDLIYGDLFANLNLKTELIVFNPPWIPASYNLEGMDKAIYYDENLFPRFFAEAEKHLEIGGRVVLLFSNLAQILQVTEYHPIERELANENRFQKEFFSQKKVGAASKKTQRNLNWRDSEMVEIWVLKMMNA